MTLLITGRQGTSVNLHLFLYAQESISIRLIHERFSTDQQIHLGANSTVLDGGTASLIFFTKKCINGDLKLQNIHIFRISDVWSCFVRLFKGGNSDGALICSNASDL